MFFFSLYNPEFPAAGNNVIIITVLQACTN